MEQDLHPAPTMIPSSRLKPIYHPPYVALVEVEILANETPWDPCLSLADAYKLDNVRQALQQQDLERASHDAQLFRLEPVQLVTS